MVDAIYSGGGDGLCCLAVKHRFGYGINSAHHTLCLYADRRLTNRMPEHRVMFIDNDYNRYDHKRHLEVVTRLRPKYVTVKDVMRIGELPQILIYAAELETAAERVILIPKVDCIADIPERYVLGYAVPTSYGGTDLPYAAFEDRPVHLLGGAWQQQRDLLLHSGMNIASLDFNHCHKLAKAGVFNDGSGIEYKLYDAMPSFSSNPYYTCMSLSLAAIRAELNRIERRHAVRQIS